MSNIAIKSEHCDLAGNNVQVFSSLGTSAEVIGSYHHGLDLYIPHLLGK